MKLPKGLNPLAKTIGALLHKTMAGRGLNPDQAAKQIGVNVVSLKYILAGRVLPRGVELQHRILGWLRGVDYSSAKVLREDEGLTKLGEVDKRQYQQIRVWFKKDGVGKKLKAYCERNNISQEEFCHVACERLLDADSDLRGLRLAIASYRQARLIQALNESPALQDILESEVSEVIKAGLVMKDWQTPEAVDEPSPLQRIVSEFAESIELDEDELEEA